MMQWIYKLGSPRYFYEMTTGFLPWLSAITFFLLIVGLVWGLGFAPPDYQMGDNYRIIYIHVPTAMGAMGAFVMLGCMAAMYMIWNLKMADMVAKSIVPVGAWLCALCLLTGALWGRPTWGTYWIWDARLTSTLILLFLYVGVMALRNAYDSETAGAKAASVLSLVGVVNVVIIYYSVQWWNTLHQGASELSASDTGANPPEIWIPAFFMGFGVISLYLLMIILRTRNEILRSEQRTQWVQELLAREVPEMKERAHA
jgi:heme exporter protein C